jgi:hypothetical protein
MSKYIYIFFLKIQKSLPQSLHLPTDFLIDICSIIPLVINLSIRSPTKMLRR